MGTLRECPECKRVYAGSLAGAWAHNANPKNKIGYFGGCCECGEKLSESYDYHGIEGKQRRVYSSEWVKWRDSLSDRQFRRIFGGKRGTICQFWYHELFKAKNKKEAKRKFLKLYRRMKRDVAGKAFLFQGASSYYALGTYCGNYGLKTVRDTREVERYLREKRSSLGVKEPYY